MLLDLEVRTLAGGLVATLALESSATIGDALRRLPAQDKVHGGGGGLHHRPHGAHNAPARQCIAFNGRVLHSRETLAACGLLSGDVLCLVRVPRAASQLSLFYNEGLGTDGLMALVGELPKGSLSLASLDLGRCGLDGDAGAAAIAAAAALAAPGLEHLKFGGNEGLGAAGVAALAGHLSGAALSLSDLSVGECGLSGPEGGRAVAKLLRAVRTDTLNLFGNCQLGPAGLLAMAEAVPPEAKALRELDVGFCGLVGADGGAALAHVAACCGVEELSACGDQLLGTAGVAALANALMVSPMGPQRLRSIELEGCGLKGEAGGRAAATLVHAAPMLEELSLSDNQELAAEGLQAFCDQLPEQVVLRSLWLGRTGLRGIKAGEVLAAIARKVPGLEELSILGNPNFSFAGVKALADGLPSANALRSLDLTSCNICGPTGVDNVVALASKCQQLEALSISGNAAMSAGGLARFGRNLRQPLARLRALHLGGCGLEGAAAGAALAKLLSTGLPAVQELGLLSNSDLGAQGLLALANGLPRNCALHFVGAEACGLCGAEGGAAAAALVRAAPSLEELGLSGNHQLGADGLSALAEGLPPLPALTRLELEDTGLQGVDGGLALASVLRAAPSLQHLGLARCDELGAAGIAALLGAVPVGSQLVSLDLRDCALSGAPDGAAVGAALGAFLAP